VCPWSSPVLVLLGPRHPDRRDGKEGRRTQEAPTEGGEQELLVGEYLSAKMKLASGYEGMK